MGHDNGLKLFFSSAATSHHNADSNQVTLHLSATNNLVTTKWIAINLSIRIYNFISTIFLNWLHYFEEQLSFILSFGGQMCTMAVSWIHNRKPYSNSTVVSRISLLQRLQPVFLKEHFVCCAEVEPCGWMWPGFFMTHKGHTANFMAHKSNLPLGRFSKDYTSLFFVLFRAVEIHAKDHISTQGVRIKQYSVIPTNVVDSSVIWGREEKRKSHSFPKKNFFHCGVSTLYFLCWTTTISNSTDYG